ncbi:metal-sulfur cluster assembly factor [bacterium]|nr:metal-sulfur cluster assembly factor [bacterium]HPF36004.1 metal-sulfur cluster assembly factor [Candidatus Krumholzibacteria bacterium]HRX51591.1 metal-sulfur cluster assembly factor [Candidatus Krumholzibacteria bacterium]
MSAPSPNAVLDAIRPVIDPELNMSLVDLGLIRGISVKEETGAVEVDLTLTSPMCPMGPEIIASVRNAVNALDGVTSCMVDLVWSPPWDPRTDASEDCRAELGIWD